MPPSPLALKSPRRCASLVTTERRLGLVTVSTGPSSYSTSSTIPMPVVSDTVLPRAPLGPIRPSMAAFQAPSRSPLLMLVTTVVAVAMRSFTR